MSTVIDQNPRAHIAAPLSDLVASTAAANDDHLQGLNGITATGIYERNSVDNTGGWNSYDVWRRLIKDARDRREAASKLPR